MHHSLVDHLFIYLFSCLFPFFVLIVKFEGGRVLKIGGGEWRAISDGIVG